MRFPKIIFLIAIALCLFHCTDEIELPTNFTTPDLVVDAWLTNQPDTQRINLTLSQDFYANRSPTGVEDATVLVCQTKLGSECFPFVHQDSGRYFWIPETGQALGQIGEEFVLGISQGSEEYAARTTLNRVPPIDSISVEFEEQSLGLDAGRYAQVYARDLPGTGDTYLIRTTFNDTLLNRPSELNLVYDATFDPGTVTDGIAFIFPIRFGINKINEDGGLDTLKSGDKIEVDLWSLSQEAFFFLSLARDQIQNGDNGIFQIPVANSPGNVFNVATQERILGVFNVAGVSQAVRIVE